MDRSATILFAEDSDDEMLIIESAFKQAGWSGPLMRAANGKEAIAYIDGAGKYADRKKFPYPTILMLDLWMPTVNGFEVLKWIRSNPKHRRMLVFVLTSEKSNQMVRETYDQGANSLLLKPTNLDEMVELAETLKSYLRVIQRPPLPL
jgi:CheY-like chemotaxis protein